MTKELQPVVDTSAVFGRLAKDRKVLTEKQYLFACKAPWEPHFDDGVFEQVFSGDCETENGWQAANEATTSLISETTGHDLVLKHYFATALLVETHAFRVAWPALRGMDDIVAIPIAPTPARWIFSYFHPGSLQLGRRISEWPHTQSVPAD